MEQVQQARQLYFLVQHLQKMIKTDLQCLLPLFSLLLAFNIPCDVFLTQSPCWFWLYCPHAWLGFWGLCGASVHDYGPVNLSLLLDKLN